MNWWNRFTDRRQEEEGNAQLTITDRTKHRYVKSTAENDLLYLCVPRHYRRIVFNFYTEDIRYVVLYKHGRRQDRFLAKWDRGRRMSQQELERQE